MSIDRRQLRWNGWGWADHPDPTAGAHGIWDRLAAALGMPALLATPARPIEDCTMPEVRLDAGALSALKAATAPERVRTDTFDRAAHARGRSYHDLLHLRDGRLSDAPDAVVYPATSEETLAVLRVAGDHGLAVVPFGGGSSVVGGVTGRPGPGQAGAIALDMTGMNRLRSIDRTALTAEVEAGIYGPALEERLGAEGFTLSHTPQSFEFSTLGGWIAARGSGQLSGRYARPDRWLVAARLATPVGLWSTEAFPASAAGPRLGDLVVGSEGAFGIITDATIRLKPAPEQRDYRGYLFRDFASGASAIRRIVQAEIPTAMLRLSDADETWFFQAFSTSPPDRSLMRRLGERYVRARGYGERPCLMIVGLEGPARRVAAARGETAAMIAACGGLAIGASAGARWYRNRYAAPYLRDPMLDHGLGVDTLETATSWPNLHRLYGAVRDAIAAAMTATAPVPGARGAVFGHVSHAYPDGASLYFTFIFPRDVGDPVGQWTAIKRAASDAIAAHGGTISHHHGVGEDHLPWLPAEKGAVGMTVLRAVKHALDPKGILNPGKLVS